MGKKKEEYPWTHFMTTHVWWASVLATLLHISVPESPSVLIDSAFALTFGVMLTGSMVSCDWLDRAERLFEFHNLMLHVLPFCLVTAALLSNPKPAASVWKIAVLAYMIPLLYGLTAKDPEKWYKTISPHTSTQRVQIMLSISIATGVLLRAFVG